MGIDRLSIVGVLLFVLTACGYKPSLHSIENLFDKRVYVEVIIDRVNPENATFVKDEINRLVYRHFKGRVTDKSIAQSQIYITYSGGSITPSAFDENGYMTRYRVNIAVNFVLYTKQGKLTKSISAIHEADVEASSLVSSTTRTTAIRAGLEKALGEFLAYVSVRGVKGETEVGVRR